MRTICLVACFLVAGAFAILNGPAALAKFKGGYTVSCGKNWITFRTELQIPKANVNRGSITIRKSQELKLKADVPNGPYIVMARSPTDPNVTLFHHVTLHAYVKIIACLD